MIRGLYTAASGMLTGLIRHEVVTHNLSNVQTIGYKADRATLTDFPSLLLTEVRQGRSLREVGQAGTGVSLGAIATDFTVGALKLTDQPFDFAIAGDGLFQVQTENGVRYTRDGRFHRDVDNALVTVEGYRVLGANGPISLPEGEVGVAPQGEIFVDGVLIDQFSLATFDDLTTLTKDSETNFAIRDGTPQLLPTNEVLIHQGYLEESNVDTAQTVTEMMSALRAYQANQRLVQFQDQINSRAATELGRV